MSKSSLIQTSIPLLKIRLRERLIPQNYPNKIVSAPDEKYFDTATNHQVAVKNLEYNSKVRPMAVAYDIIEEDIQIITIHPTTEQEIKNKLERKRWIKNEKA